MKRCRNSALIARADLGHLDEQSLARDFQNGGAVFANQEPANGLFPYVGLVPRLLLRRDMLTLKCSIGPPAEAGSIQLHGFGKKLIAIADQRVNLD